MHRNLPHKYFSDQATRPALPDVLSNKQANHMVEDRNLSKLIAGCQSSDEGSQLALYRHYYSYGMGICLRYARNRESALEILNDGFLKVFTKIDQYDKTYPFRPWLRKILVNGAIDHFRKYDQKKNRDDFRPLTHPLTHNNALDQLAFEDLMSVMQTIPPSYRMAFNLYVVENMSHAEIAQELGISIGTSKSNLAKARNKIKELLGIALDIHLKTK